MIPTKLIPDIRVSEPKNEIGSVPKVNIGLPVDPVQFILLPARGISSVTVCEAENAELIITSSCGSGTRPVHTFVDQFPPDVPDHV